MGRVAELKLKWDAMGASSIFLLDWELSDLRSHAIKLAGSWLAVGILELEGRAGARVRSHLLLPDEGRAGFWTAPLGSGIGIRADGLILVPNQFVLKVAPSSAGLSQWEKLREMARACCFDKRQPALRVTSLPDGVCVRSVKTFGQSPSRLRREARGAPQAAQATSPPGRKSMSRAARLQSALAAKADTPPPGSVSKPSALARLTSDTSVPRGTSFLLEMEKTGDMFKAQRTYMRGKRPLGPIAGSSLAGIGVRSPLGAGSGRPTPLSQRMRVSELTRARPAASTPRVSGMGLRNLGNTCYMNAVLQALTACEAFRADLESEVWRRVLGEERRRRSGEEVGSPSRYALPSEPALAHAALIKVVQGLVRGAKGQETVDPSALRRAIGAKRRALSSFAQQDAHEFLVELLDVLVEEDVPRVRRACAVVLNGVQRLEDAPPSPLADLCLAATEWVADSEESAFPTPAHIGMVFAGASHEDAARVVARRAGGKPGAGRAPAAAEGAAGASEVIDLSETPTVPGGARKRARTGAAAGSAASDASAVVAVDCAPAKRRAGPSSAPAGEVSGGNTGCGAEWGKDGEDAGEESVAGARAGGGDDEVGADSAEDAAAAGARGGWPDSGAGAEEGDAGLPAEGDDEDGYDLELDASGPADEEAVRHVRRACDAALAAMPVSRCFRGVVRTTITCEGCGHVRTSRTAYNVLSLDGPGRHAGADDVGLQHLLTKFFEGEEMDVTCPECQHGRAVHRLQLESLPKVLVLHVKRFDVQFSALGAPKLSKDSTGVAAPPLIRLDGCLAETCTRAPEGPLAARGAPPADAVRAGEGAAAGAAARPPRYSLKSIVCHHGEEAYYGHYTALVRQRVPGAEGLQFVEFNDSSSRVVARHRDVLFYCTKPEVQRTGYMFFYELAGPGREEEAGAPDGSGLPARRPGCDAAKPNPFSVRKEQ